jgi:hypothetical protein
MNVQRGSIIKVERKGYFAVLALYGRTARLLPITNRQEAIGQPYWSDLPASYRVINQPQASPSVPR